MVALVADNFVLRERMAGVQLIDHTVDVVVLVIDSDTWTPLLTSTQAVCTIPLPAHKLVTIVHVDTPEHIIELTTLRLTA
jgi:hypothetical protein